MFDIYLQNIWWKKTLTVVLVAWIGDILMSCSEKTGGRDFNCTVKDGLKNRKCDKPTDSLAGHFSPWLAIPYPCAKL